MFDLKSFKIQTGMQKPFNFSGQYKTVFDIFQKLEKGENRKEHPTKQKAWEELKKNVRALQKPRNILLVGSFGAGKSSFINTAITALTGEFDFYADVGSGSKPNTTRVHRYTT